jgi:hypothetical protein
MQGKTIGGGGGRCPLKNPPYGISGRAFSFGLLGPMKKHLKSQMADFRSSRMFAGAAARGEVCD